MYRFLIKVVSYSFALISGKCQSDPLSESKLKGKVLEIKTKKDDRKDDLWTEFSSQVVTNILEKKICHFLRWKVIRQTMFPISSPYLLKEFSSLRFDDGWSLKWRLALKESGAGSPIRYWRYPKTSGNTVHMAYHLLRLEKMTQTDISDYDLIIEFGGGYGNMCRVSYNAGFSGRYCIYDIEVMTELQRYYLSTSLKNGEKLPKGDIFLTSNFEEIEKIVHENTELKTLFIATWSLSESPVEIRDRVVPLFDKIDTIFAAYQNNFSSYDNQDFFNKMRQRILKDWTLEPIEHMPNDSYVSGTTKES